MTNHNQAYPIGGFYPMDEEGYIINPCSLHHLTDKQTFISRILYEELQKIRHATFHSLWLRGSAARGYGQSATSDLDFVVLVADERVGRWAALPEGAMLQAELQQHIAAPPPLDIAQSAVTAAGRLDPRIAMVLATAAVRVGGQPLSLPDRYRPTDLLLNYRWLSEDRLAFRAGKLTAQAFCKVILRTLQEITVSRSGRYTPDLFYCSAEFARYYPAQAAWGWELLWHYLHPATDPAACAEIIDRLWPFLRREISEWIEVE